jgi:hypothetical protein
MKELIRNIHNDKGYLPKYSSLGCYPLYYVDGNDEILCAECATESLDDYDERNVPVAFDANWEDPSLFCACGEQIESAYEKTDE